MKQRIPIPEHGQDFEDLCKRLFGKIYSISNEIKKNGRNGQGQKGVDIYFKNEKDGLVGIQCKKTAGNLTKNLERKINKDIEAALNFEPKLDIFIIATTIEKDVEIEKFVRIKTEESENKGNFKILLYCWDDICDIMREHRKIYDWYVRGIVRGEYSINISPMENVLKPKFLKTITEYKKKDPLIRYPLIVEISKRNCLFPNKNNFSCCSFEISIVNTGEQVLEDWKIYFYFSDDAKVVKDPNSILFENTNVIVYEDGNYILFKPYNNSSLVQDDSRTFIGYCIPKAESKEIRIDWELLARDFSTKDSFVLKVEPEYEIKREVKYTKDETLIGELKEKISEYNIE